MTEQEYIDATNLAKVRMTIHCARDMLFLDIQEKEFLAGIIRNLYVIQDDLDKKVKTHG